MVFFYVKEYLYKSGIRLKFKLLTIVAYPLPTVNSVICSAAWGEGGRGGRRGQAWALHVDCCHAGYVYFVVFCFRADHGRILRHIAWMVQYSVLVEYEKSPSTS
jgi:hypothetical protein